MGNTQHQFLCPECEYGKFFRTVKNEQGIVIDVQYICEYKKLTGVPNGPTDINGRCDCFKEGIQKRILPCKVGTTKKRSIA